MRGAERSGDDALRAAVHLGSGAPRKRQQQNARRIGTVDDQMRDAMRQRVGLARSGPGDNQQWWRNVGAATDDAVFDGATLVVVELGQIRHGTRGIVVHDEMPPD